MYNQRSIFVIPTYRLRDVGETLEAYDAHFAANGHSVELVVFDDSSAATSEKYYASLERTRTKNPLFYVGPAEKEGLVGHLNRRLRDRKLEPLVRNLFRPSYGGNRNCTLMYTLGSFVVSADDDMRPWALVEDSPESLDRDEVARGKLFRAGSRGYTKKSFDILAAFHEVLGQRVEALPPNYARGQLIRDSSMDLETNASLGLSRENTLVVERGEVPSNAVVKVAQTFRSGTNDIDAVDYVDLFLADEDKLDPEQLNEVYVLVNFRPAVTLENWRIDCGVAAYDNRLGLPPFFPTRLRFEDYIYRLWVRQQGIVAAHVDAAQTHTKSNYMRNPLPAEVFNEEIANLLKRKIRESLVRVDELGIEFGYEGHVSAADTEAILEKITHLHARVLEAAARAKTPERRTALERFAVTLEKTFYGLDPDFFHQNVSRIVDDVVSEFRGSLELWPTLVEIGYLQTHRAGFPRRRVENLRAEA